MSGIYNAPDGQQLHGDGKPVGRPPSGDCITDRIFQQHDEITRLRDALAAANERLLNNAANHDLERTAIRADLAAARASLTHHQNEAMKHVREILDLRADVARLREALQNIQPVLAGGLAVIAYNALAATAKP